MHWKLTELPNPVEKPLWTKGWLYYHQIICLKYLQSHKSYPLLTAWDCVTRVQRSYPWRLTLILLLSELSRVLYWEHFMWRCFRTLYCPCALFIQCSHWFYHCSPFSLPFLHRLFWCKLGCICRGGRVWRKLTWLVGGARRMISLCAKETRTHRILITSAYGRGKCGEIWQEASFLGPVWPLYHAASGTSRLHSIFVD